MSRLDSRDFNPAQVYAQFTTSGKNESAVADKSECKHERVHQNNRREIQITETAEASLPPDKARVSVVCSNSKESVEEVKTSVNRRVDYVLQTLRSNHIKDFSIRKTLKRTQMFFHLEVEVVVEFSDFSKCEQVCNILVEKLDEMVKVSSPVLFHTPGKLDGLRRQACVSAVQNAKKKSMEMVQMFNQSLGPPLLIKEEHYEEYVGTNLELLQNAKTEQLSFHQMVAMATVTVSVKIFVIFEIRDKAKVLKHK